MDIHRGEIVVAQLTPDAEVQMGESASEVTVVENVVDAETLVETEHVMMADPNVEAQDGDYDNYTRIKRCHRLGKNGGYFVKRLV